MFYVINLQAKLYLSSQSINVLMEKNYLVGVKKTRKTITRHKTYFIAYSDNNTGSWHGRV